MQDIDVNVMPLDLGPRRIAARWRVALPAFLRKVHKVTRHAPRTRLGMHALGSADHEGPLNTGVMLLRPSRFLYMDGLRVLRQCRLNTTHGWGLVGPPQSLSLGPPRFFSSASGGTMVPSEALIHGKRALYVPLNWTMAFRRNNWKFVAGAEDQGTPLLARSASLALAPPCL